MHFWSKFGDSSLNGWQVIVRTTSKWCKIRLSSLIWPLTGEELSRGQTRDWHTDRQTEIHTHTQRQATTIPKGQNWPRVINQVIQLWPGITCRNRLLIQPDKDLVEYTAHKIFKSLVPVKITRNISIFIGFIWSDLQNSIFDESNVIHRKFKTNIMVHPYPSLSLI